MNEQDTRWYQKVIPIVISVIIGLMIIYFLRGKPDLDQTSVILSSILSFMGILIAVCIFDSEQKNERDKIQTELRRGRQKTNLEFRERIRVGLQTLKTDLDNVIIPTFGKKDHKQYEHGIANKQVGTEIYDMLLGSGIYGYFEKDTQLALGNLYFNIKLHNRWLTDKTRFKFEHELGYGTGDNYDEAIKNIESFVKVLENDIIQHIAKLEQCLTVEATKRSLKFN